MTRGFKIFFAFLAGLVLGEGSSIGYYLLATTYFGVFDRDGGGAMGAIFILGPILAVLFGTIAAIIVAMRTAQPRRS